MFAIVLGGWWGFKVVSAAAGSVVNSTSTRKRSPLLSRRLPLLKVASTVA
ncbi:hypothetical protein [Nocardia neocaledoniensis]|nr:hypothetical protein [Nocardia neocaledoniensis]